MNELVSVIVPTYKRPEMLKRALKSLALQTYKNLEVIIVDDNGKGSVYDDELSDIVDEFQDVFNKLVYIKNQNNMGGGPSRNEGIKVATGNFVTFLDDDDEYYPNKIEKQYERFVNSELDNLGYVYCQIDFFDENKKKLKQSKNFYKGNRLPYLQHFRACISGTPTIFAKTEVLRNIGGFKNLKSGQDWALVADILRKGYSVDYSIEPLVAVYQHKEERISTSAGKYESMQNELLELKKHYVANESLEMQNDVLAHHFYQLASAFKYDDRRKAWNYFTHSRTYKLPFKKQVKFIISWLLGRQIMSLLGQ